MLKPTAQSAPDVAACIAAEIKAPAAAPLSALADAIRRRHGPAVAAILYYGSCFRTGEVAGHVVDLYVLVDGYRAAYGRTAPALFNALLPPNVYALEIGSDGETVRAKYAVLSLRSFCRGASRRAWLCSIWARFCQSCALVYARDEAAEAFVVETLAAAVETMVRATEPLMPATFTPQDLWVTGFAETYRTEVRAERSDRPLALYQSDARRYDRLAQAVLGADTASPPDNAVLRRVSSRGRGRRTRAAWWARRRLGKTASLLRLVKGVYTFAGGVDYILWKVEQHSGVTITLSPWQRRHPVLAAPCVLLRHFRRGAFR
ncbi:MAG: hypothetical protein ACE5H8_08555 [Alphaproteobacteria bacterium]